MVIKINRAAKKIVKALKGQVNFKSISRYLNTLGYIVREYDTENPDVILIEKALVKHSEGIRGFTYRKMDEKIVFIKTSLSTEEKLYTLLHELGHIVLEHFDNRNAKDARLLEMEAETFAFYMLKNRMPYQRIYSYILVSAVSIILTYIYSCVTF